MKRIIFALTAFFVILFAPSSVFADQKHIEIDLSKQELFAFDGDKLVYDFVISSGKWYPTPTGSFKPYAKLLSQRMRGGNPALGTFYDLPGVPFVVYFYQGYALHGTYWHDNFGHPMSHGCINVRTSDMALLYNWIDMSTNINIYGLTPQS